MTDRPPTTADGDSEGRVATAGRSTGAGHQPTAPQTDDAEGDGISRTE